jgi:dTDP-4-dehydrorhamnose 3,5-epimerase
MGQIKAEKTPIGGLLVVEAAIYRDSRGCFAETYSKRDMAEAGIGAEFVQDNQSVSNKGVLRGLHFQAKHPQAKLVRCARGAIFDVAVDLRAGSPTFGKWFGLELTGGNGRQLFIPEGLAHGFLALSDSATVCYKATDYYHPGDEAGIAWNDPGIGIAWPEVEGEYKCGASVEGYRLVGGQNLIASAVDQGWPILKIE